jgi:predicted nucleic acid-binding protein
MEAIAGIADTGFLVALLSKTDVKHQLVLSLYGKLTKPMLVPQTVLAETAYMVGRSAGMMAVTVFLRSLRVRGSRLRLCALTEQDIDRIAEILEEYQDSRIDFVDASVMAIAERYQTSTIFTIDQRDFRIFRPRHVDHLWLLPS